MLRVGKGKGGANRGIGGMSQLVKYEAARHALQQATAVDEVKDIKDKTEALRLYARQANDRDMEVWTSEIKVRAVRRIGELSAALETAQGYREPLPDIRKKCDVLADAGISTSSAHEYERVAAIPEDEFEQHIAESREQRAPVSVAGILKPHVANNNGNNGWYTPPVFIAAAREVMGSIDIDPASSEVANRTVGASTYYTEQSNGLAHEWKGCVWMNPPYAQPLIAEFCDRLVAQVKAGNTLQACVLVNNATETTWFKSLLGVATAVCFTRGRVRFLDPDGNPGAPLQGQAVLYVGSSVQRFRERFAELGKVLIA